MEGLLLQKRNAQLHTVEEILVILLRNESSFNTEIS